MARVAENAPPNARAVHRRSMQIALVFLGIVALIALGALFDAASTHAFSANSDGASVVLEGAAVQHGNVALAGWSLSLDSFWTVDVPFYTVALFFVGLTPGIMHLVPSVLAVLVVAAVTWLALRDESRRARIASGAVIAAVLVLPNHVLAYFLLQGPWHVGTVLYCLVAMGLLAFGRTYRSWIPAMLLLALGLLGDLQTLTFGVIPVFCGGLAASLRTRRVRDGLRCETAAAASVVVALLGRLIADAAGTFRISESHHTTSLTQAESSLGDLINWGTALLGLHRGVFGGPSVPSVLTMPRILVALLLVVAVIATALNLLFGIITGPRANVTPKDRLVDDLVFFGLCGSLGTYFELTLSNNPSYARYLNSVVVFAVVIAARFAGRAVERIGPWSLRVGALAAAVVLGSSGAVLGIDLASAAPPMQTAQLTSFLDAHGLHEGVGDYWAASIVTVDSKASVRIRPVVANLDGIVVPDGRNASSRWYDGKTFSFLVYDREPFGRVEESTVEKTFGAPSKTYVVGEYTIDVWSHPLTLSRIPFP